MIRIEVRDRLPYRWRQVVDRMVGPHADVMVTGCNHEFIAILLVAWGQREAAVQHAIDMISVSVEINTNAILPWQKDFLYKWKRWINR